MASLPPEVEYPMKPFQWCLYTCYPNLMFLASTWLEIYIDFKTGHFVNFEQFMVDINFANFRQVKIDPICSLWTLDRSQLFYWVWPRHAVKNNPNPLHLMKNSRTTQDLAQVIFNDSLSKNQEVVSSVNK